MLRSRILHWVGIPVSIGIGTTKTLAKIANEIAKHDEEFCGVLDISSKSYIDSFLRRIAIEDVWGVGRRLAPILRSYRITSALDLKNASEEWIQKRFSITLKRTVLELRGISCIPFGEESDFQETIMSSRSFGKAVVSFHDLFEAISQYIGIACEKLRRQRACASYIYVYIRTNIHKPGKHFYANGVGVGLPSPTAYTPIFTHYARELLHTLYKPGLLYKKAGVVLSGIVPDLRLQMNLFGDAHYTNRQRRVMNAVDVVNTEFGSDTVLFASSGIQRGWSGKRNLRSSRFTTRWDELLRVSV
jgi:DNA polymerase V